MPDYAEPSPQFGETEIGMAFEIGDIVQLKSGGPLLTVMAADGGEVTCIFFSEELGEFRTHAFAPALLVGVALEDDDELDDEGGDDEDDDEIEEDEDDEEEAAERRPGRR